MVAVHRTHRFIFCCTLAAAVWILGSAVLSAADKAPVPPADAQNAALALVKDVYGGEYAEARSSEQKTAFAQKLLQSAQETNQGTANHYALLRVAWDVATQAGDAKQAMQITEAISGAYEVNALSAKVATVKTTDGFARTAKQNTVLATVALKTVDAAVAGDDYDRANELAEMALAAARKAREWQLVKQIVARGKAVSEMAETHGKAEEALATLENDPTNPAANQAAGEYYCFVKRDWRKGIPMLALGTDAALKTLARRELEIPATPSQQAKLGDAWWDLGETQDEDMKGRLRSRAAYWYRQVVPSLSGLVKQKYEKRLEQISETEATSEEKAVPPAAGAWIDALAAVDVGKHRVHGNWTPRDGEFTLAARETGDRILIPFAPKGDYDLQVSFTRQQGVYLIGVVLPLESKQCLFAVSARTNTMTAVGELYGKPLGTDKSRVPFKITNKQRHELNISVRQTGTAVAITAVLDGQPHFRWEGPQSALSLPQNFTLPSSQSLGLCTEGNSRIPTLISFHEVKLKVVRGAVQKLTDGTLSERPPAEAKQPAAGTLPGIESASACTKLEAKKPPVGLTPGAIPFSAPRGDGRSGANGFLVEATAGWETRGTAWACTYRRAHGDARGVQFIHPFRTGHIVVTVSRNGLHVGSPGKWPSHGFTPTQRTSLPLAKAINYAQAFDIEGDPARKLVSVLAPNGRYQFVLDGQLVAWSVVPFAMPLQLTPDFNGADLPMTLRLGMGGVIIGPRDRGENRATDITFGLLNPAGR